MNIRDERTVGEQVKSGFRLAGWVLFTLAFIFLVLGSTNLFLGKGDYARPIYRLLGACGLVATSAAMFATVRHWVKWFIGVLGYLAIKALITFLLRPSMVPPRFWYLEIGLLTGFALLLCARYLRGKPTKIETAGLVCLVVALSFTIVSDSNVPLLLGLAVLVLIQLAHSSKFGTVGIELSKHPVKRDDMDSSLKRLFVPALRERGFKGSLPHFRRPMTDRIDLLTVQFDKWAGGFVIEISKCPPDGITTSWGQHIPPNKVRAWDMNERERLGSPRAGEDGHWFRFDDGTPTDEVAKTAASYLREADLWWNK